MTTAPTLIEIPVAHLKPASDNPRQKLHGIDGLAASIKAAGVLQPLVVTSNGTPGQYTIVAGHRRHAAAKKAGLKVVPCVIHQDLDDSTRREAMAIENLQREDLTPLEEAAAFQQLVDLPVTPTWTQKRIAERVGCDQSHVSKRLALLKLPGDARRALDAGTLRLEDAALLAKHADTPEIITAVLKANTRDVAWTLKSKVRDHEREKNLAALTDELKAKGVKIVEFKGHYNDSQAVLGAGYYELDVDKRKHAKEPCHAVALGFNGFDSVKPAATHVCTDPGRHAPKGKSDLKGKRKGHDSGTARRGSAQDQAKARADAKERRAAASERATLIAALVEKPTTIPNADRTAWVERRFLLEAGTLNADPRRQLATLLGLPEGSTRDGDAMRAAIDTYAAESTADRTRAVVALLLVQGEHAWNDTERRQYRQLLVDQGYEPASIEKADFKGITPAERDRARARQAEVDFVEANDLQPGDEVLDDGAIVRAADVDDTDTVRQTTVDDHAGTIPIGHTASRHEYVDNGKKDECGLCGRRRNAHEISGTAPNADATSAGGENVPEKQAGTNGKGKRSRTRTNAA